MPTMIDLGTPKPHKMSPKSDKKCSKIDAKTKRQKEPNQDDLRPSWAPSLGQNRAPALGGGRIFKNHAFAKKRGQETTWRRFGRPKGCKMALQNVKKAIKK